MGASERRRRPPRPAVRANQLVQSVILAALVVLAWPNQEGAPVDESLISSDPCAAPCWQGLTPSVTSGAAALQWLKDSPLVADKSGPTYYYQPAGPDYFQSWWWSGLTGENDPRNSFDIEGNHGSPLLVGIELYLQGDISVGQFMAVHGPPTFWQAGYVPRYDIFSGPPHVVSSAFYTEQRLEVTWYDQVELPSSGTWCPRLDTRLERAHFLSPGRTGELLDRYSHTSEHGTYGVNLPGDQIFTVTPQGVAASCEQLLP